MPFAKSSENTLRNNWNRIAVSSKAIFLSWYVNVEEEDVRLSQRRERIWKFCQVFVLRKNISWVSLSRARGKVSPGGRNRRIEADVGKLHARLVIENCASRNRENGSLSEQRHEKLVTPLNRRDFPPCVTLEIFTLNPLSK